MGLYVGSVNHANYGRVAIDTQALAKVSEQILNPNNQNSVDVSKLDLSKFNRVSLGTDLYAARTSNEVALQASKAATDFGINFSQNFVQNVQYLNSQAAQSLLSQKETGDRCNFVGGKQIKDFRDIRAAELLLGLRLQQGVYQAFRMRTEPLSERTGQIKIVVYKSRVGFLNLGRKKNANASIISALMAKRICWG